ncbi:hypothetical protein [Caballeronia calidae]|uniref:hypothetical protein n=1 Tax=Caballeronia calidae TaxID=1777139 RepID=UPI0007870F68|nr:hypothetical protein [Caballeronia calidae]
MFLSYLIDRGDRSVQEVKDGFDRAAELTNSTAPELISLWADLNEADSTVDVAYSPEADEEPSFRVRLSYRGKLIDHLICGKGVLIACGAVPPEIAQQIQTPDAVARAVEFLSADPTSVHTWLKKDMPTARAPARRTEADARSRPSRDVALRRK